MSELGYSVRDKHILAAIEKADPAERRQLEPLLNQVTALNDIERTLADRVRDAQVAAGQAKTKPSRAAREVMAQSADAARELDRLLTRKCERAQTACDVIREILAVAKHDMREANWLDTAIADDDPAKSIYTDRYWKQREFVASLRLFLAG